MISHFFLSVSDFFLSFWRKDLIDETCEIFEIASGWENMTATVAAGFNKKGLRGLRPRRGDTSLQIVELQNKLIFGSKEVDDGFLFVPCSISVKQK